MITAHDRVARVLARLDTAWREFHESYAGLSDAQMLEPGVTGAWSVRDLIAHVSWWEEEALQHVPLVLAGGRPLRYSVTYGGIDSFNALMTERWREWSLDEVRERSVSTHRRLVAYLQSVPADKLATHTRTRRRLRLDTYGHYPIHTVDIQAWRATRTTTSS